MNQWKAALRRWAYADRKDYFYSDNREALCRMNLTLLLCITGIAFALLLAFFLFSSLMPTNLRHFFTYGAFGLINIAVWLLARRYRKRTAAPAACDALCVIYLLLTLCFGVGVSVFFNPDAPGCLYILFLSVGQLLFVIPPLYSTGAALLGAVGVAVCSYFVKAPEIAMIDAANALCGVAVGAFLCWYIIRLRVKEDENKQRILALNRQLKRLSGIDELTGLVNRRQFHFNYDAMFSACLASGAPLLFLMADLDFFKAYNDHYGHIAGDECLRSVGRVLRELAQEYGLSASRYGGEEFTLMGTGTSREDASAIASRLVHEIAALNLPHACSKAAPCVTISCGVHCAAVTQGANQIEFINRADCALYEAKHRGGNQACSSL